MNGIVLVKEYRCGIAKKVKSDFLANAIELRGRMKSKIC